MINWLTQEYIKTRIKYDPKTGEVFSLITGKELRRKPNPYVRISVKNPENNSYVLVGIHQLAWLYMFGWLPDQVDHKDNIKSHNWISNLRPCTDRQNRQNSKRPKNNTSGRKCVILRKWKRLDGTVSHAWRVNIRVVLKDGSFKRIKSGHFQTFDEACKEHEKLAKKYHKEFARLS